MKRFFRFILLMSLFVSVTPAVASDDIDGAKVFETNCQICHAFDRKKLGPAVNTMVNDEDILRMIISDGKRRMPKFNNRLDEEAIDAVVMFIQESLGPKNEPLEVLTVE